MKMFIIEKLLKFDADSGSNGGASPTVEEPKNTDDKNLNSDVEKDDKQFNVADLTQEQLDEIAKEKGFITESKLEEILENRQKRWEKDFQKKEERSKLSVKEQLALELEEVQKENERLKAEQLKKDLESNVILDLNKSDIPYNQDLISLIVANDEETTVNNVNIFKDYANELRTSIEKTVREELRGGGYQSFPSGKPNKSITKQDILNIKDDIKRQQAMAENIHLFV